MFKLFPYVHFLWGNILEILMKFQICKSLQQFDSRWLWLMTLCHHRKKWRSWGSNINSLCRIDSVATKADLAGDDWVDHDGRVRPKHVLQNRYCRLLAKPALLDTLLLQELSFRNTTMLIYACCQAHWIKHQSEVSTQEETASPNSIKAMARLVIPQSPKGRACQPLHLTKGEVKDCSEQAYSM